MKPLVAVAVAVLAVAAATGVRAEGEGVEDDVAFDGPPGWRMVDRFSGFRYQLGAGTATPEAVADKATELGCFGWSQPTAAGMVVGEARCAKVVGPALQAWLQAQDGSAVLKDYENTKIKLHFSHFKILPELRRTCFRDEPHQCDKEAGAADPAADPPAAAASSLASEL